MGGGVKYNARLTKYTGTMHMFYFNFFYQFELKICIYRCAHLIL